MVGSTIEEIKKKGISYPFRCGYCGLKVNIKSEIIKQSFLFENCALGISVVLHKKCKIDFLRSMKIVECLDCKKTIVVCNNKNICHDCQIKRIKKGNFN